MRRGLRAGPSRRPSEYDVTTVSRSAATRVQPLLPALVRAELGANLIMEASQLTPAALTTFKHAASMSNPKFYELQRLRKSTWAHAAFHPRLRRHVR